MVLEPSTNWTSLKVLEAQRSKMFKREVPKINRDNFPAWKSLMRLHLGGIGDHAQSSMKLEHVDTVGVPTAE